MVKVILYYVCWFSNKNGETLFCLKLRFNIHLFKMEQNTFAFLLTKNAGKIEKLRPALGLEDRVFCCKHNGVSCKNLQLFHLIQRWVDLKYSGGEAPSGSVDGIVCPKA